jgi:5-deoxy-D-glucuronate isomerase
VGCSDAYDHATFCIASAPVEGKYPLQYVPYSEVCKNGPGAQREINLLVAHNVLAGRLIVGATRSLPGNWTSWPPHEHATTLEESYFYYDMPEPAFGLQRWLGLFEQIPVILRWRVCLGYAAKASGSWLTWA